MACLGVTGGYAWGWGSAFTTLASRVLRALPVKLALFVLSFTVHALSNTWIQRSHEGVASFSSGGTSLDKIPSRRVREAVYGREIQFAERPSKILACQ